MLNEEEKYRYNRHLILDQVGIEGQERLKNAKVLVIGAGGLGCPVLQYLTAAGVGTIGIIDDDKVDVTNLQRQILFNTDDIGQSKAETAARHLSAQNPLVKFMVFNERLTNKNALFIFEEFDLIVDGTDNFSTRYLVNDASLLTRKPLVYGSIFKFEGQVSVFNYKNGPSYRCLFPEPPKSGSVPNCSQIGVIGILPGLIGCMQANEALKIILQIGEPLSGKLVMYNALTASSMTIQIQRNEQVIQEVMVGREEFEDFDYEVFCGLEPLQSDDIEMETFEQLLKEETIVILDVREPHEMPRIEHPNLIEIPMKNHGEYAEILDRDRKTVVVCQSGIRSRLVIDQLKEHHAYSNLLNLKEGLYNYGK